ncbi:MAG: histidinol-phosphatase HisJ [Tissierellia bacterium]|nr:histidinol-phosphatase HisJ [Tissierellia bacterium]
MYIKVDGHTHTEFCPHGNGDYAEEMIIRAIEYGYDSYSITEHAPLPKNLLNSSDISKVYDLDEFNMKSSDLPYYFKEMNRLKVKYKDRIKINVGFEFDYFEDYEIELRDFLEEYHSLIDDALISIHFMPGNGGLRAVDYSAEDFGDGLLDYYGSFKELEKAYLNLISKLIYADLGRYKPNRIGHISLYKKFILYDYKRDFGSIKDSKLPDDLIRQILHSDMVLDFNQSGFRKKYLQDSYPPRNEMPDLLRKGVKFYLGSDAHGVEDLVK